MGRFKKLLLPTIAAAVGLTILLNLGFWQLDRLAWKEALIKSVETSLSLAPKTAPPPSDWPELHEREFVDYQRVTVSGQFLPGTAYYYLSLSDPKGPYGGPGYFVYSPFETQDGWHLMVNRGFVPQGLPDNQRVEIEQSILEAKTITGLLRMSEAPNWTTPEPDTQKRIWFARDTDQMAKTLGLNAMDIAPYSIDLDAGFTDKSGLPQAGETIVRFKNDHLGYALTWFGLAATLIGVFAAYAASVLWPRKSKTTDS